MKSRPGLKKFHVHVCGVYRTHYSCAGLQQNVLYVLGNYEAKEIYSHKKEAKTLYRIDWVCPIPRLAIRFFNADHLVVELGIHQYNCC